MKESDKTLHSVTSCVNFDYSSIQQMRGERPRAAEYYCIMFYHTFRMFAQA